MNCSDVRDALLQGDIQDHAPLRDHLDQCEACSALVRRIQEQETLMTALLDAHTHADTFDAAWAAVPSRRQPWRWVAASLLAAAAVATFSLVTLLPPTDPTHPAAPAAGETASIDVPLGVGRSLLLDAGGPIRSLSVVDPGGVRIQSGGEGPHFFVQGLVDGVETEVEAILDDGTVRSWWVTVDEDAPVAPQKTRGIVPLRPRSLELRVGERRHLPQRETAPTAVFVTDPGMAVVGTTEPTDITIDGIVAGTTDVWVSDGKQWSVWVVTVQP